jgi:hypothetical protein
MLLWCVRVVWFGIRREREFTSYKQFRQQAKCRFCISLGGFVWESPNSLSNSNEIPKQKNDVWSLVRQIKKRAAQREQEWERECTSWPGVNRLLKLRANVQYLSIAWIEERNLLICSGGYCSGRTRKVSQISVTPAFTSANEIQKKEYQVNTHTHTLTPRIPISQRIDIMGEINKTKRGRSTNWSIDSDSDSDLDLDFWEEWKILNWYYVFTRWNGSRKNDLKSFRINCRTIELFTKRIHFFLDHINCIFNRRQDHLNQ